ncbi:SWI/SNF and RSC complexes subunit ssr4 [Leucoagaricus sp. SymC.cos]|nr:SWI/SNF and RSC complexes subunit ssr4 [Leucoagaricus sp. SymC.cos]
MSSPLAQAQSEGLCLRYPESAGVHREISLEGAVTMLLRAAHVAQTVPFTWGYIDKPGEGQTYVIFLPPDRPFPNDGIRYQDNEAKIVVPVGNGREMEIGEVKFGFIPNSQDQQAWRFRRRYRLIKGSPCPQLVLVHYTRSQPAPINPALFGQPVRGYPLRGVTESGVFVAGERAGQKAQPQGNMMHGQVPPGPPGMPPMNIHQQQAMVAHQNNNMEIMERRQRERQAAERAANPPGGRPPRPEDDDSGDEVDQVSTRTLSMARYKRNHEMMNEVFQTAAFGNKAIPPKPSISSIFSQTELEAKVVRHMWLHSL